MAFPEWVSGNIYIRKNRLEKAGDRIDGHAHNFDHTTYIVEGPIRITAKLLDGTVLERDFERGTPVLIRAGVEHELTALVDHCEFDCIYSHRDPQGRITQAFTGWEPAYR